MRLNRIALLLATALPAFVLGGCQDQTRWMRQGWEEYRYDRGWVSRHQAVQWVISEDPDLRCKGIGILNRKGFDGLPKTQEYVRTLAIAQAERSAVVRGAAIRAQAHAGDNAEAMTILLAAVNDRDSYVRTEACVVLGKLGDPKAIEPLAKVLRNDAFSDVRAAAADALGAFRDKKAALALAGSVGDQDFLVAHSCLGSLKKLTGENLGYKATKWSEWINAQADPFAKAGQRPPGPVKPEDKPGAKLKKWMFFWKTDPRERVE